MAGDGLQRIRERLQQIRQARKDAIAATLKAAQEHARGLNGTPVAGDKVFDTVSGQEGTVIGGTRENIVIQTPDR